MTYFNLRKQQPEPAEAEAEEELAAAPAEESPEAQPSAKKEPTKQPGCLGVLLLSVGRPSAWMTARFGASAALVVHLVGAWAFFFYGSWVAAGEIFVWLLLVGVFAPREHVERLAARVEQRDAERSPQRARTTGPAAPVTPAAREAPADPLPRILWDLIGEAPGVHLPSIVRHLHQTGLDRACDRAAVRAALGRRGITIRPSVREADGRVNQGVHRDDLKAWEEARSPAPTAVGPKARSYSATEALTSDVAAPATGVATPSTPVI